MSSFEDSLRRPSAGCIAVWLMSLLVWCDTVSPALAQQSTRELRVAAAADLAPVMPVLAQRYKEKTGVTLVVMTASSGAITSQILNGAPVDLFLGADFEYPERIVAAGLADSRAPTPYARGSLVLWARKDSPAQPLSLDRLTQPAVAKVAVADQLRAPFGRAAMAAIEHLRLKDVLAGKLVIAENVGQAGQFAVSGNAQVAFVSLTLASSEPFRQAGSYVQVPTNLYPEIQQNAVVLERGRKAEAHAFLDWLLSSPIQGDLHTFGLTPVR